MPRHPADFWNPADYKFCLAVAQCLEGDYSDWTIYDSFDDPDVYITGDFGQWAAVNRDETKILLFDFNGDKLKSYDILTKTLTDLGIVSPSYPEWGYNSDVSAISSAYRTYCVIVDSYNEVKIIKNGAVVKTLTYADLGIDSTQIRTANISPMGKYIVVSGKRTATGNAGWVILVGS